VKRKCGDGVSYHLTRDGEQLWSSDEQLLRQAGEDVHQISLEITNGQVFDFVVAANQDDRCDYTTLKIIIERNH